MKLEKMAKELEEFETDLKERQEGRLQQALADLAGEEPKTTPTEFSELIREAQVLPAGEARSQEDTQVYYEKKRQERETALREKRRKRALRAANEKKPKDDQGFKGWVVRFKRFDLQREPDIKELESIMTSTLSGQAIVRQERFDDDNKAVLVSWLEPGLELKNRQAQIARQKEEHKEKHTDPDTGEPYLIQPPFMPTIDDEFYPDEGLIIEEE